MDIFTNPTPWQQLAGKEGSWQRSMGGWLWTTERSTTWTGVASETEFTRTSQLNFPPEGAECWQEGGSWLSAAAREKYSRLVLVNAISPVQMEAAQVPWSMGIVAHLSE